MFRWHLSRSLNSLIPHDVHLSQAATRSAPPTAEDVSVSPVFRCACQSACGSRPGRRTPPRVNELSVLRHVHSEHRLLFNSPQFDQILVLAMMKLLTICGAFLFSFPADPIVVITSYVCVLSTSIHICNSLCSVRVHGCFSERVPLDSLTPAFNGTARRSQAAGASAGPGGALASGCANARILATSYKCFRFRTARFVVEFEGSAGCTSRCRNELWSGC